MLDVLGEFCDMSGYPFERLDGDMKADARQQAIDKFQKPVGEKGFAQVVNQVSGDAVTY